jgi:hypothetical protein
MQRDDLAASIIRPAARAAEFAAAEPGGGPGVASYDEIWVGIAGNGP